MNNATALRLAQECLSPDIEKVSVRSIARLWSGMGNIYEVNATGGSGHVMIVKYIEPRLGNKKDLGDQRKFDSYVVEAAFFETYASDFLQHHSICIPKPLKVEREGTKTIICMSRLENATIDDVADGVVQWLANFHAATWHKDYPALQPIGSYWYLDTRPDEYNSMPTHGWEGRLKRAARAIADYLKRDSLQCLIHGDAKDANVMSSNGQVAMCDFQYCGRGSPTMDVAYFLVSSVSPHEEERLVDLYFESLCEKLSPGQRPTRKQFDNNLGLAYCDYARFLSGWGFWGFDIKDRVIQILNRLDGGKILSTEKAYDEAIRREFE
jgi:Phosphotransferase enzyme family